MGGSTRGKCCPPAAGAWRSGKHRCRGGARCSGSLKLPAYPADKVAMKTLRLPLLAVSLLAAALAQRVGTPTDDLTKVGVDELFSVQVTSVGRKAQQLSKSPAAVFVLTAEDIRRSGATSIPEALQWVPGMTVLSLDGRSWAVSISGSSRLYADKILVMIDGRSLYTPLFSDRKSVV